VCFLPRSHPVVPIPESCTMNSRRTRPLWDKSSPAITPDRPTPEVSELHQLKRSLLRERNRHAAVERVFVKSLDELQTTLDTVRMLYIQQIAPKPGPSERK
jgi:hypothetical protein